jgi:ABC-type transport system substrate-binding protein
MMALRLSTPDLSGLQILYDALVELYQQMDAIIIQDAPVVPLWYDEVVNFLQPSITGFIPNALNIPDLRKVKKEVGGKN